MLDKTNTTEIQEDLTDRGQELVIDEAVGKIRKRVTSTGVVKKVKRGATSGQKLKNTGGRSASARKRSAIKTLRSKKKKFGKAISTKTAKKIKRAKKKRASKGL